MGLDSLMLQVMLSLSMVVASEEAAGAALRRRRGVLRVLNSTTTRAMPVRRSRRDEARRLVAADDALAVDDGSVCRGYSMGLVIVAVDGFMFTARRQ